VFSLFNDDDDDDDNPGAFMIENDLPPSVCSKFQDGTSKWL
jgi:hypothetical protein